MHPHIYPVVELARAIDGDTVIVVVDVGFHLTAKQHFRLLGVDTPERNSKDAAERQKALEAKAYVEGWFYYHMNAEPDEEGAHDVTVRSHKSDSFGRWLGEFECDCGGNLQEALLTEQLAVPWKR